MVSAILLSIKTIVYILLPQENMKFRKNTAIMLLIEAGEIIRLL